jgi:DNA primase
MNSSVARDIKDRLDIVEYVSRFVPDLKKQGSMYKACCPFHSEKTPSFVVNPANQSWRCFGQCAEGGDIFNFAMKRHGWSFSEALHELGRLAGVETERRSPEQRRQDARREHLLSMMKTAAEFYHQHLMSDAPDAAPVRAYAMQQRGFTEETLARFQIGYAPDGWDHMLTALRDLGYSQDDIREVGLVSANDRGRVYDRFRHRLMIPIRDERGRVVGFGARALNPDDNPKYLNSPQSVLFDKSRILFALDVAKTAIRETGLAVIVEGYMDAIQAHQAGFTNVVAQMGTAMTEPQLRLIVPRYTQRIILALDADAAGQNAMRRSLEVARQTLETDASGRMNAEIRIMQLADAKDPDDILRESPHLWQQSVENAMPVADFVIALETQDLPTSATMQERQALAQRLLPILAASENNLYNKENVQKLALRLRLDERDVLAWAEENRRNQKARPPQPSSPPMPRPAPPAPDPFGDAPPPLTEMMTNSEEPPLWPDAAAPHAAPAPQPSQMTSRHLSREAERFCLQMLVRDFGFYYEVNRRFREVFQGVEGSLDHPLTRLEPEDFGESDYRLLMQYLMEANRQEDQTPSEYLLNHLDESLLEVWALLQQDDAAEVHTRIGGRMTSEMHDILKSQERHTPSEKERQRQALRRMLEVRDKRLRRELLELKFLISDAGANDPAEIRQLMLHVQNTLRAQFLFQKGIEDEDRR